MIAVAESSAPTSADAFPPNTKLCVVFGIFQPNSVFGEKIYVYRQAICVQRTPDPELQLGDPNNFEFGSPSFTERN
jgi:hypothetical protein